MEDSEPILKKRTPEKDLERNDPHSIFLNLISKHYINNIR